LITDDGALIFDESGFVKKGNDSIGVGIQYCGSIGKVENCQIGVFAAYASPYGYALLDKRLFIEALESLIGMTYFVQVPEDTRCWLKRPITREKQCKYKGKIRSKAVLSSRQARPVIKIPQCCINNMAKDN